MGKATQCVHSGSIPDRMNRGLNSPSSSSSFAYLDATENVYPRYFNTPNQQAVVEKLCALEGTESGLLFSSGMAAISAAIFDEGSPRRGAASRSARAGEGTRRNGRCPAPGGSETHVPSILGCIVPNLHAVRTPFPHRSAKSA